MMTPVFSLRVAGCEIQTNLTLAAFQMASLTETVLTDLQRLEIPLFFAFKVCPFSHLGRIFLIQGTRDFTRNLWDILLVQHRDAFCNIRT